MKIYGVRLGSDARFMVLNLVERNIGYLSQERAIRAHERMTAHRVSIINECTADCGENVGGSSAAPAAPEVASDDDGGDGDGDPDPERQTQSKRTRTSRKSAPPPAFLARPKDACSILNVGRTKLHQLSEEDPRFPRKIVLGSRCVGWRVDALHDYLRACEREG